MQRINFKPSESVTTGFANLRSEGKNFVDYVRTHPIKSTIHTALCAGAVAAPVGVSVFSTYYLGGIVRDFIKNRHQTTRSTKFTQLYTISFAAAVGIAWPLSLAGDANTKTLKDAENVARQHAVSVIESSQTSAAIGSAPYLTNSIWKWTSDHHEIHVKAYVDDQSGPYITIKTDDDYRYYWKRPSVSKTSFSQALDAK